ncbi:MAG: ribonuclease E/G [Lachnospiraceae bacterium]|nr:ribonuclease E/G [Lachnospiraceae bacterium]
MSNRIIITKETIQEKDFLVTALFEENRLAEVSCDNLQNISILGNIYVGKIKQIVPKIGAAFIEITPGQMTYLPLNDVKEPHMVRQQRPGKLTENDEIVVQIAKEAVKTKFPTVSTNLTFQGNAIVLTTENKKLGISKKLDKEKRKHYQKVFADKKDDRFGLIIRTIAGNYADEEIFAEFERIYAVYQKLESQYMHRTCYSCLYHAPSPYISAVKEKLSQQIEKIVTDDRVIFNELTEEFIPEAKGSALTASADYPLNKSIKTPPVSFYEDSMLPLSALYGLKAKLQDALQERVWLKSGAYLVIQPTEALTVIDVNSGKCIKGNPNDFYLKINLEAAEEIARQLRLRNISGICVVDFINMDTKEAEIELVQAIKKALAKDTVPAMFVDFTKLGLAEITRKKVKKPLWEQIEM